MTIITIYDQPVLLSQKSQFISIDQEGLEEAKFLSNTLIETLRPLMPAAGLAAPQIGILKQVFIFSWDRSVENIEIVINPEILEFSSENYKSWEACFSTIQEQGACQAACIGRSSQLIVKYHNLQGQIVHKTLKGFAAKVFQHEFDHLQGLENVRKKNADIKIFSTKKELESFMISVKEKDQSQYIKPMNIFEEI